MTHHIGPAEPGEVPLLPEIERRACALFLQIPATADLPLYLTPLEDFVTAQRSGLLWTARVGGAPIGFALVEALGDGLHLEELDVLPEQGRRGVGRALVEVVCGHARQRGRRLTRCTFRDVPWNAPFYERLGFRILAEDEIGRALAGRIAEETSRGLPPELRVAMELT